MYKVFKSKNHEGITAEKSYSYSKHYLLLSETRSHICQVSCDQIEGSGSWEEVIQEPVYTKLDFTMSLEQVNKFEEWRKVKNDKIRKDGESPNNCYTYSFTPTGIGLGVEVSCTDGTKIDLTEYDKW